MLVSPAIEEIDLNADAGESFGRYVLGEDEALMSSVTSVSVACGWHAGDPGVIRRAIELAHEAGVQVGAHPGYPDLQGFGRRSLRMSPHEVTDGVIYQVAAVAGLAAAQGVTLSHVKPHGALYNDACDDAATARAIVDGIALVDGRLALYAPPGSQLAAAGTAAGLHVVAEGFADRAYQDDGRLVDRSMPDAVLQDPVRVAERAVAWMQSGRVATAGGGRLALRIRTLCVHGDTAGAAAMCLALRSALVAVGVRVQAPLP